jgi:hypothetical protein
MGFHKTHLTCERDFKTGGIRLAFVNIQEGESQTCIYRCEQQALHLICVFDKERFCDENFWVRCFEGENLWKDHYIGRAITLVR